KRISRLRKTQPEVRTQKLEVRSCLLTSEFSVLTSGCWPFRQPACSIVEQERHEHVHLILTDLSVLDPYRLLLDPGALDVADRLVRPHDTALDRIFEAGVRGRGDFRYFGNVHSVSPSVGARSAARSS